MKTASFLSLAAAAVAAPAPQAYGSTNSPFSGISSHSASPVHLLPINAAGLEFWLGKETAIYCPEAQVDCSGSTTATIFGGNNDALSLDVTVPGGQQVYVAADGQLKYTQAHSMNQGQGSTAVGFKQVDGRLQFEGDDWYACPADGAYKIYAATKSTGEGCTGFSFITGGQTNFKPAWSYS